MLDLRSVVVALTAAISVCQPLLAQTPGAENGPALRGHGGPVRALVVVDDGRIATAGLDGAIILWNVGAGRAERVIKPHATAVNALAVRRDGCIVSGGEDGAVAITCGDRRVSAFAGHQGPVSTVAIDPRSEVVVSGAWDRTVRLWHADGRSQPIAEHDAPITVAVFGHDGRTVLSGSFDGQLRLSHIGGEAPPLRLALPSPVNAAILLDDGHFLVACADGALREIDGELELVRTIQLPDGPLTTVARSPDGKTLATGGMRTPATLLDRATGQVQARILGPGLPLWAMAFSRDGSELYTGGADRAVRRFDVASGQALGSSIGPSGATEIADGKDPGALVFRACRACHGLTAADTHLAGPSLHGVIGRRIASLPGYDYAPGLKQLDIVWTKEAIARLFEVGPMVMTPGTKMPEQRITDPADRKALVDWLAKVTAP